MRKKVSVLTKEKIEYVDYKDVNLLRRFISDRAKIRARRITGNNEQQQRAVALAIKNAREMALLPYENRVTSQRRILESGQFGIFTHEDALEEQAEREYFTSGDGAPDGISAGGGPSAATEDVSPASDFGDDPAGPADTAAADAPTDADASAETDSSIADASAGADAPTAADATDVDTSAGADATTDAPAADSAADAPADNDEPQGAQ